MKQFKAESKRLLDLMINSIYTNKEIFLRELISNCSDAMDKLHYQSLTNSKIKLNQEDLKIKIELDKEKRTLTISDHGCGMTAEELEKNLGTIAKSGSLAFKEENLKENGQTKAEAEVEIEAEPDINIIGQFGVGFYSAFMVSDCVTVYSKSYQEEKAHVWKSKGAEGYTIEECDKPEIGTTIVLNIKPDTDEENYSEYLEQYTIENLVKKYSDYIRYPIQMEVEHSKLKEGSKDEYETVKELETLNSMVPIWKKKKADIKQEEYDSFYISKFNDYEKPQKVVHTSIEGQYSYNALLYIPSHVPFDYYSTEYEKGLQLYSNGVLIMEKCADLLPDYFAFVKGLVDSPDLSLNISREMLQQDRQLKTIAKSIEKKISNELQNMMKNDREEYEKFFHNFGSQLKYGTYSNYGMDKEKLQDFLLFYSSKENKLVSLKEYIERMPEGQEKIYYACGESNDKIAMMPQVESVQEKGYEILYLTENLDEFVLQTINQYEGKSFANVCANDVDLDTEEEKKELEKANKENESMFNEMKKAIEGEVEQIRFTHRLKNHPVCLTSEGGLSVEMEKVINSMPNDQKVKAQTVLEINENHPIAEKLKQIYSNKEEKETLARYTKILYAQARLIEGLSVENPTEISNLICELISK